MPALAHIGLGFAAKKIVPTVNVVLLIVAAELIEIIFMTLWAIGIEHPPDAAAPPYSPYSHSILMGLVWSGLAAFIFFLVNRKLKISLLLGLLVLSHLVLDFIASPKSAFYPADTGLPWFSDYTATYGLGLWSNSMVAWFGEIGILLIGISIYIITVRKLHNNKNRILKYK
jgi:hypothetical protein